MAGVEVISSREVPLGGPRATSVRRTLPQRQRSLVGAWCFADHYGPDDVATSGGMDAGRTRPLLLGWNFVGRSHEQVAEARERWRAGSARFSEADGHTGATQHLPAPPLPHGRIRPRVQPLGALGRGAWG